jgi:chitodextrinase
MGRARVFHVNCMGLRNPVGDSVTVSVRKPPPLETSTTPTMRASTSLRCGGVVDLEWLAVRRATRYELMRDAVTVAEVTGTRASDAGLAPDSTYSYQVRALGDGRKTRYSASVQARASMECEP